MTETYLYFEDFSTGQTEEIGSRTVTKDEIVEFAAEFDPQPFHLDEAAGQRTPYGGLIASGWHTCGILMRMMCDHHLLNSSSLGAPGVEECRWLKPVRPGDTLSASVEVLETRRSESKPRGYVRRRFTMVNQGGEPVLSLTAINIFGLRPVAAE